MAANISSTPPDPDENKIIHLTSRLVHFVELFTNINESGDITADIKDIINILMDHKSFLTKFLKRISDAQNIAQNIRPLAQSNTGKPIRARSMSVRESARPASARSTLLERSMSEQPSHEPDIIHFCKSDSSSFTTGQLLQFLTVLSHVSTTSRDLDCSEYTECLFVIKKGYFLSKNYKLQLQDTADAGKELGDLVKTNLDQIKNQFDEREKTGTDTGGQTHAMELARAINGINQLLQELGLKFKYSTGLIGDFMRLEREVIQRWGLVKENKLQRIERKRNPMSHGVGCWLQGKREDIRRIEFTLVDPCVSLGPKETYIGICFSLKAVNKTVWFTKADWRCSVTVPYMPEYDDAREIKVLVKGQYGDTDGIAYELVEKGDLPCIEFQLEPDSDEWLVTVLLLTQPRVHRKVVGENGATVQSDIDSTVQVVVPPGFIEGEEVIQIKTVPKGKLPLAQMKDEYSELLNASSMVYPSLPPAQLNQIVSIVLQMVRKQSDVGQAKTHVEALTGQKNGAWSTKPADKINESQYKTDITSDISKVLLVETKKEMEKNRACNLAKSMENKLNEYKVNMHVLQHDETPDLVHVDCSPADVASKRLSDLKKRGFSKRPLKRDIFLQEGAIIHIKCHGDLAMEKSHVKLSFTSQLCRPVEVQIVPRQKENPMKGIIVCSVAWEDLGDTERKLLNSKKSEDLVDVSKSPIVLRNAIADIREECKVNMIIVQNCSNLKLLHVDCSPVEQVKDRLADLKDRGFRDKLYKKDIVLMDGANIDVSCSGDMRLEGGNVKLQFSSGMHRPIECELIPLNANRLLQGQIKCKAKVSDLGSLEVKLLDSKAMHPDRKIELYEIHLSAMHDGTDGNPADYLFYQVVQKLSEFYMVVLERRQFLRVLGLTDVDLLEIEQRYNPRSVKDELRDGLYMWRDRMGEKAKSGCLVGALNEIKLLRPADAIEEIMRGK